jgi:hypothetical protein
MIANFVAADIETSFNIVFDAEYLRNMDDVVQHVAIDNPAGFFTNISQTNFSISSNIINEKNRNLDAILEFDFMGENGFEIVSAYLYYKTGNLFFNVGKLENLVATTEKTLDYDGYYSAGGIQTGVLANMRQARIGYNIGDFKLSFAITDELPSNGSIKKINYYMQQPAVEASISFENKTMNSKIASHIAKINTDKEESFTAMILMNETNINFAPFGLKLSGFYSQAGSQFFVVDEMFDFYFFNEKIESVNNYGGYGQLIYDLKKSSVWLGVGGFFTDKTDIENLKDLDVNFLKSNLRFSFGFEYEVLKNTKIFFEYSKYITYRIEDKNENRYKGDSFHFQVSIEF